MNALLRPSLSLATRKITESPALATVIAKCRTHSQSQFQEVPRKREFPRTMKMFGWQIHSYGDLDEVQFSDNIRIPQVRLGTEVMVRVKAASVNPIDVAMISKKNQPNFYLDLNKICCFSVQEDMEPLS